MTSLTCYLMPADPNGGTLVPLFGAALANNKHAALRLLERNADATVQVVNPWNKDVTDALTIQQHAERANANDVVELLLERGGTISTIHGAAKANDLETMKALLDAGADINEGEPQRGSTALHMAKSVEAVKLLIERGADVNKLDRYEYSAGRVFAAQEDTDETIAKLELLFDAGLDPNGAGWRTLHSAISSGKKKIAKYLIDRGAPVDSKKKWVKQPLHVAAEFDQVELADLLLDKGANIHAWAYNIHGGGDTPLHVAAQYNGCRVAELLLKRGADASLHDGEEGNWDSGRYVPIHHAVESENFEMVCILLRHGVGVYEPLRGRDLTEISEDHPEIHELVCAVLDDDMTVDEFLTKRNEVHVQSTAYDSEGVFWVERIEQKIPDGTGLAPPALKKAMRVSDWVRTPPGMKYSLVLRLEHAKYRAYVGDETGMHTLPVVIAGKSLHYLAGPDDGYFLLSDFDNVYFVNAETRSVDRLLEAKDLGSKLAGMGRTSLGFLLNLESDLRHYRWAPGELPELLWKMPKGNLSGLSAFGAPLVGLSFADRTGEVVWAVADEAGLRLHSRLNEPLVLTGSRRTDSGMEAMAYTNWNPPVRVLRFHHLEGVTTDSEPITEMPTLKERDALPLCTYRS